MRLLAKITLIGMYNYDNTLFAGFSELPEGIDNTTLINTILLRGGEFGCVFSDLDFMKQAISLWATTHYRTIDKWLTALDLQYNPLENYDRIEEWSDDGAHSKSDTENGTMSSQSSDSTNILDTTNNTTENKVSAYDSSTYSPKDQTTNTGSETTNNTTIGSRSGTTSNSLTESGEDHSTHSGRVHGNIGVTTSQQMLESELKLARFNLYDQIAQLFIANFCIYLY